MPEGEGGPVKRPSPGEQERAAIAALKTCVWPTCTKPPRYIGGTYLPLCTNHAIRTWSAVDRSDEERPTLTEHMLNRRLENDRRRQREDAERDSRAIEPGWIYYVRVTDRIKIGYSTDVRQRMRAYPPHAELLAVHPGTLTLERQVHAEFKGHLAQGREWFRPDAAVMAHIDEVLAEFGPVPPSFRYTFRDGTSAQVKPHRKSRRTTRS